MIENTLKLKILELKILFNCHVLESGYWLKSSIKHLLLLFYLIDGETIEKIIMKIHSIKQTIFNKSKIQQRIFRKT